MSVEAVVTGSALDWSVLARSFGGAIPVAALAVIPPYLTWLRYPAGNARGEQKEQRDRAKRAAKDARAAYHNLHPHDEEGEWRTGEEARRSEATTVGEEVAKKAREQAIRDRLSKAEREARAQAARKGAIANALRPERDLGIVVRDCLRMLGTDLRGFSADWNFKDNWVSSLGLTAAVFTGVFTSTGIVEGMVGKDPTSSSIVLLIAVAAGLSAGLVGAGPIFLTICKKRWVDDDGAAKYNTVLGVLIASMIVIVGITGLVLAAATALKSGPVWAIAGGTLGVLVVYSWKSIPQILADGSDASGNLPTTPLL
jgi:hypothetical protein